MKNSFPQPDTAQRALLEEVVGYLNFSSGASDPQFLRNINALFRAIEPQCDDHTETGVEAPPALSSPRLPNHQSAKQPGNRCGATPVTLSQPVCILCAWLETRMNELPAEKPAFGDVGQALAVVGLLRDHLLKAYRNFHRDLLWHQSDRELWRPLLLGRAFEALLAQGGPWNETDRIIAGALETLNDYLGYRPVAVLESERQMEPYSHERVRPVPLYVHEVGVAPGRYDALIERAMAILRDTDPEILHQAGFDPQLVEELSLDPRAYEFDHPASKRPNHHFGQWDLHHIDNRGHYRRFVLQQVSLDALLSRIESLSGQDGNVVPGAATAASTRDELLFESAAVLAGTILMASGTTGSGPGFYSSDVALSNLLPQIAAYRDQFYEQLLSHTTGPHAEKLRAEAQRTRQPFGGARQFLNHELARLRASQMQHVHLAQLYARMGYPEAALDEAHVVRIASARMLCKIYCLLTAGHQAIDEHQLEPVAKFVPEIEGLLTRGIECGALVDPWNIVGFGGNYSLFPALENTVHDFRVDDLVELVEQILDLCARAWTEAAAIDDASHEAVFSAALERLATWWDKYATASVSDIKRLVGKEIEVSTNLVAGALSAWHKAGAAAGDVKFWRMFVDQFDSPKAFQLVIEALLERGDQVASMALMLQWISQVDHTALEDGDASFHPLALRWLWAVDERERLTGEDQWPLIAKFFSHLEASADAYWHVPTFELQGEPLDDDEIDEEDDELGDDEDIDDVIGEEEPWSETDDEEEGDEDDLYRNAWEGVVYRDSTDDGLDADVFDELGMESEFELEEEAQRLGSHLEFLTTVARLWRQMAIAWKIDPKRHPDRCELFDNWCQQAVDRYAHLLELIEAVDRYPLSHPTGAHESMVEYDRQRMIKDSLVEQIVSTSVQTADAARLLCAASGKPATCAAESDHELDMCGALDVLRGVLAGDAEAVSAAWPAFVEWLSAQELLYVPLARNGKPRRIVRARTCGQLIYDLLGWLPRLGLIRETCQLLDIAQAMETEHPVGQGAVTEYDRLFGCGYQAIVRALVASAEGWDLERTANPAAPIAGRPSDTMLVEALEDLTESQLNRWLAHSKTLRLSVVERLGDRDEWQAFVAFIERYGKDLFTQKFLNPGNLRAILHQRTTVWLSNLEQDPDFEDLLMVQELGTAVSHDDAAKWLTIAIEAIVENYREYRDYNTTTTHSDHGELLYTLIDFLRLRASYDRVAWNLRPVVMAHEILVRQNRPAAADRWQQGLAERTAETADANLARFEELCREYGVRLPSIAERLGERFTRPLAIDRVRGLVAPAIDAVDRNNQAPFAALRQEIASLGHEPAGAGLDLPDWLEALEDEVTMVRCARRHRQPSDDVLRRVDQIRLSWDDWQQQIGDDTPE